MRTQSEGKPSPLRSLKGDHVCISREAEILAHMVNTFSQGQSHREIDGHTKEMIPYCDLPRDALDEGKHWMNIENEYPRTTDSEFNHI